MRRKVKSRGSRTRPLAHSATSPSSSRTSSDSRPSSSRAVQRRAFTPRTYQRRATRLDRPGFRTQNARPGTREEAGPARHRSPSLPASSMDQVVNLAKRRGFVFPASEIYGGLNSCWDYGPLGVELKRNVKEAWWRSMVLTRRHVLGLDSAILQHPQVWRTSGHVHNFRDPPVDCRQ